MYKNVLSALAFTAISVPVMAQDAPAAPAPAPAPAPVAAPAPEAAPVEAAVEAAPALSPEKQAKIEKELTELETLIINSGIDMSKTQPSMADMVTMLGIINPFISRTDLEPETIQNLLQMKLMLSMVTAKDAADLEVLKTELMAIAANYPDVKAMIEDGVTQMYAEGAEKLFEQLAPLRAQMQAAEEGPAAPAAEVVPAAPAPAAAATATGGSSCCAE